MSHYWVSKITIDLHFLLIPKLLKCESQEWRMTSWRGVGGWNVEVTPSEVIQCCSGCYYKNVYKDRCVSEMGTLKKVWWSELDYLQGMIIGALKYAVQQGEWRSCYCQKFKIKLVIYCLGIGDLFWLTCVSGIELRRFLSWHPLLSGTVYLESLLLFCSVTAEWLSDCTGNNVLGTAALMSQRNSCISRLLLVTGYLLMNHWSCYFVASFFSFDELLHFCLILIRNTLVTCAGEI